MKELLLAKQKIMQEQGDNYPNWVLDQLGIETELANRIVMGRGLQSPRFRWVPFDDALMYPAQNIFHWPVKLLTANSFSSGKTCCYAGT